MNIGDFYKSLNEINIGGCEEYLHKIEETIQQCKVAIKNEKSRRTLLFEIQKKTQEEHKKRKKKKNSSLKGELEDCDKQRHIL